MTVPLAVARTVVEHGDTARLAVRGKSMVPSYREPMTIDVVALRDRPARIGEVLVFELGDAYVAHRVVKRRGDAYVTSGDACPEVLEHVPAGDVLGRVRAVWSDGSGSAIRVDGTLHRARGLLYARGRPFRLLIRRLAGAWQHARRRHPEV